MKIYIETLGCPKNTTDSEAVAGLLIHHGYKLVENAYDADVLMVNTCGFIHDAQEESIDNIIELSMVKKEIDGCLVVMGCLSQRYGQSLFDELPEVDLFIGVNEYENMHFLLENLVKGKRQMTINKSTQHVMDTGFRELSTPGYFAYLKIAEGCDNYCSYCIIPFIRGGFRSRPLDAIISEAQTLANNGVKEITLIAQDVTSYGNDLYGEYALPKLVKELVKVEGIHWIRLMYCYPHLITDELIDIIADEEKVCNYIDIPIQHCNNDMLKEMNRKNTKEELVEVIEKLRTKIPDIHIRTSLIAGLPNETDEKYEELRTFVEDMHLERVGVFKYSKEEGTKAARMPNQVEEEVKVERLNELMALQQSISLENNTKLIGKVLEVIIDEKQADEDVYIGRTQYDAIEIDNTVIIPSKVALKIGSFVNVTINEAWEYDLIGEVTDESSK